MSTVELRLCSEIVSNAFGKIVMQVAYTLASKGALTLPNLALLSKLTGKQVREALFVLIHHNLVKYEDGLGELTGPYHLESAPLYHLDMEAVVLRLAYPLFITMVDSTHGEKFGHVLLEVVKHGRVDMNHFDGGNDPEVKAAFQTLSNYGFLEPVTSESGLVSDTIPAPPSEESPKKRKAAAGTISSIRSPDKKRLKSTLVSSTEGASTFVRLNCKKFVESYWDHLLIQYADKRINQSASKILHSILHLIRSSESPCSSGSGGVNTFQLHQQMTKDMQDVSLLPLLIEKMGNGYGNGSGFNSRASESPLGQFLQIMTKELCWFRRTGDQSGGQYMIDFNASLRSLQLSAIEAYIVSRYGQPSARIFRILLDKEKLEEKTICKLSMMTAKETRERLYHLLQGGIVQIQEVPKTADHAPSRTIFLWTIVMSNVVHEIVERLKKTMVNLLERANHERKKHKVILSKAERTDVRANADLLNPNEQKQLLLLKKLLMRLEFQIKRILEEYLLFNCFKKHC